MIDDGAVENFEGSQSSKRKYLIFMLTVLGIGTIILFFCKREKLTGRSTVSRLGGGTNSQQQGNADPSVFIPEDIFKSLLTSEVVLSLPNFLLRGFVSQPLVQSHPAKHLLEAVRGADYRTVWGNESKSTEADGDGDATGDTAAEGDTDQKQLQSKKVGKRAKTANLAETGLPEVEATDVERARQAIIRPLPKLDTDQTLGPPRSVALYNFLISFMQESQVDAEPLIADFGCNLGPLLAAGHLNSTVLCFVRPDASDDTVQRQEDTGNDQETNGASDAPSSSPSSPQDRKKRRKGGKNTGGKPTPPSGDAASPIEGGPGPKATAVNLFPVTAKGGFLGSPFSLLYKSCHLFSTSFLLSNLLDSSQPTVTAINNCDRQARLTGNVLRMSKTTFLAVPLKCLRSVRSVVEELNLLSHYRLDILGAVLPDSFGPIAKRKTDVPLAAEEQPTLLVRVVMQRHRRPSCQKLWGKPKVGKRDVAFHYNGGLVTIEIIDSGSKKVLRRIHPLSYIVSFNVDTLISMGVPRSTSQRLLGQMIQVPFYHDPFPQNWVIAGGGKVVRIDKDDKNYLAHKSESQNYWARSTRGYFHLLGAHLCMKINNGLPAALLREPCRGQCLPCASQCDFSAKSQGLPVCSQCLECGTCVTRQGLLLSSSGGADRVRACPSDRPYGGNIWAKGRDFWKRWEAADQRTELPR
jgi:hypothetical protein